MDNKDNTIWATYCEPMHRFKCRVIQEDIPEAIKWYQGAVGRTPNLIALNPSCQNMTIPLGMKLSLIPGCLSFEIWLGEGKVERGEEETVQKIIMEERNES